MDCVCGLGYERIAENEVKEVTANGSRQTLPENRIEPTIKSNGHQATNGQ
jgi:ATP-dependent Clp protease adapter protein ClpS